MKNNAFLKKILFLMVAMFVYYNANIVFADEISIKVSQVLEEKKVEKEIKCEQTEDKSIIFVSDPVKIVLDDDKTSVSERDTLMLQENNNNLKENIQNQNNIDKQTVLQKKAMVLLAETRSDEVLTKVYQVLEEKKVEKEIKSEQTEDKSIIFVSDPVKIVLDDDKTSVSEQDTLILPENNNLKENIQNQQELKNKENLKNEDLKKIYDVRTYNNQVIPMAYGYENGVLFMKVFFEN